MANNISCLKFLVDRGADVNFSDEVYQITCSYDQLLGVPVLHTASMLNFRDIVETLIENGANVNAVDNVSFVSCRVTKNRSIRQHFIGLLEITLVPVSSSLWRKEPMLQLRMM
jgi:hypothetical protein